MQIKSPFLIKLMKIKTVIPHLFVRVWEMGTFVQFS